jgi:hypothetical protein
LGEEAFGVGGAGEDGEVFFFEGVDDGARDAGAVLDVLDGESGLFAGLAEELADFLRLFVHWGGE